MSGNGGMAMDAAERQHLEELRGAHQQRLHALELQAARAGDAAPPEILTEIVNLRGTIKQIDEQLDRITNLLHHSFPVPIFSVGKSECAIDLAAGKAMIDFRNDQTWSGVAFIFTPALDVRGFTHLRISGTATRAFKLSLEYKVRAGSELKVVTSFLYQPFPATMQVSTMPIPVRYDGRVDEITLMFFVVGDASQLVIESIRLSN
jgi:hypothetical protein